MSENVKATLPWEDQHQDYIDSLIKASICLHRQDNEQKLIVHACTLIPAPRLDEKVSAVGLKLPSSTELLSCFTFGCTSLYFIPDEHRKDFQGRLPRVIPPGWVKLSAKMARWDEDDAPNREKGWIRIPEPEGGSLANQTGIVIIQPATATITLGQRLRLLQTNPDVLPVHLAPKSLSLRPNEMAPPVDWTHSEANDEQQLAVRNVLANAISLIEGPPGTGKSWVVVRIIEEMLARGKTVLVCAQSNDAVDAVASKVIDFGKQAPDSHVGKALKAAKIVRTGSASGAVAEISFRRLKNKKTGKVFSQSKAMSWGSLVFSTLYGLVSTEPVAFGCVIVDEAGAVGLPWWYVSAACATDCVVAVGDGKQYEPFVGYKRLPAEVEKWFSTSIYGLLKTDSSGLEDPRIVRLAVQHRMRDEIAALIRGLNLYHSYRTSPNVQARLVDTAVEVPGLPSCPLVVIDTSMAPFPPFDRNTNSHHFGIATRLAVATWNNSQAGSVGIITPYAFQADLYAQWLRENGIEIGIEAGTVHRFQGSESDIIIFDSVESVSAPRPQRRDFRLDA